MNVVDKLTGNSEYRYFSIYIIDLSDSVYNLICY